MSEKSKTPLRRFDLFKKYKRQNSIFFETGTHYGESVALANNLEFDSILSIEINSEFYNLCMSTFKNNPKVKLFLGDSVEKLPEMLSYIDKPTLFWLDAHINTGDLVFKELELIKALPSNNHTIIIDDIPLYFNGKLDALKEKLLEINKNFKFILEDALNEGNNKTLEDYDLVAYE